jgi:pimeloyl-ACP methyl ester carboxylesterase
MKLSVPGAEIVYDVSGPLPPTSDHPVLLMIGQPMTADGFEALAGHFTDRTVVRYDPRGLGRSTRTDGRLDNTPQQQAADLHQLVEALGAGPVDVFGSSGGAVTGLALVARHPARVRTLVAHEPPVLDLLPDAADRHAATEQIISTYHRDGAEAAFLRFMATAGYDLDHLAESMPPGEPSEQDVADNNRFFAHELRGTTRYTPDIAALTAGPARVVVGVGAESGRLLTYRTSAALADRLGVTMTEFPGDHGGFIVHPQEFADVVRKVLAERT